MEKRNVKEIIYRKDLYPRFEPNPKVIQQYRESIEELPPIVISPTNILIDGFHRWKAHQDAKKETIEVEVLQVESETEIFYEAIKRNARYGMQLSNDEKKSIAIKLYGTDDDVIIIGMLSVPRRTYSDWVKDRRDQLEREKKKKIWNYWLACYSENKIGELTDTPRDTVHTIIVDKKDVEIGNIAKTNNFFKTHEVKGKDDVPEGPELYDVWTFSRLTNEVKHPGNIPSLIGYIFEGVITRGMLLFSRLPG